MNFLKKIFSAKGLPAQMGGKKKEKNRSEEKTVEIHAPKEIASVSEAKEIKRGSVPGVITYPHITEKTSASSGINKYVFAVSGSANKPEILRAVESRYGVKVESVNVLNSPGKERVRGRQKGWRSGFKKAMVTLKEGQSIEIL